MPRARIPNASLIASGEFAILPFLAPRVFAESPIWRRSNQQHGKRVRIQKEKEVAVNGQKERDSKRTATPHRNSGYFGRTVGLSQPFPSPWTTPNNLPKLTSAELHCADISAFARQSARNYSTGRTVTGVARLRISHSRQQGSVAASRRAKALALERKRLAKFVHREPGYDAANPLKNGRYRSLRRRITNLRQWNATRVDLTSLGRVGDGSGDYNRLIRPFAALDRRVYDTVMRHTNRIIIKHHPRCKVWSAHLFRDDAKHNLGQAWHNWMEFDVGTRKVAFLCLLVYLLDRKPGRAMQFIRVMANDPVLRDLKNEAIADGLGHLAKLHRRGIYHRKQDWNQDPTTDKHNFVPSFVHVFRTALAGHRQICSQDLLYNIVHLAEAGDQRKVFDCLIENGTRLGGDTLLHYASTFAASGDAQSAVYCLHKAKDLSSDVGWKKLAERERLRWTCALILRKSMSRGEDYHETPGIVEAFVGLGIRMDILLYNVVIHNAMDAGDYATAFKVYNTLEKNGLEADKHTHSILLHGCTTQSNPVMFSAFAEHCADVAEKTEDPWLATDYLYYLYIRDQDNPDNHRRGLLQKAYLRFFPMRPLELLFNGLRDPKQAVVRPAHSSDESKLELPVAALYVILQRQIQIALGTSNQRVLNFYKRFKLVVSQDSHPAITTLARDPIIWNAFLLAFCQKQQFGSASQLIKDMTRDGPQPNIYSWNIFMQAFFKTGQVHAAERIFDMVRSRGVDPDQYTYGVQLRGYAKAQLIERIGEIMVEADHEQEMAPDLLRALSKVVNRDKLMLTLEKSRIHKQSLAKQRQDKEVARDHERWVEPRYTRTDLGDYRAGTTAEAAERFAEIYISAKLSDIKQSELAQEHEVKEQPRADEPRPPSTSRRSENDYNSFDPEVAYKKLQEEMGLVTDENYGLDANPATPIGANLGFKPMVSGNMMKPPVSKEPSKSKKTRSLPSKKGRSGGK
jgi:pentatricopeptide repeat protein